MSRTLVIPPVNVPGGEAGLGRMEVLLELVDAAGDPIPSSDPGNTLAIHGLGSHIVTDTAVELDLATQNELADETYYRVTVRHGRHEFRRDVQVPADPADITWAQFLGLTNPVTGGLAWAARLLPGDATDGQFAIYDEDTGLWQAVSVAPGAGVEEAPIDGTPYARQDAGWVAAFAGGDGDVVDGGTLATGLTFPADGLHIFDTNASHDLILSPGSNLTADRTLTITTGDANRVLTLTADASVGGTNTGDVTVADSTTVDLSLTGQQVSGAVISQMSITSDASGIKLDGDSATPGNTKLYGTNVSGTKGWYDQPAGGDGHDAVTLAGTLDYLTITGQEITRGAIDLATDVTGALPVANGGTGVTALASIDAADLGSGAAADNLVLTTDGSGGAAWEAAAGGGVTDHGALTGLTDDDHTQYGLLLGRAGGQTLIGGTAASEILTLRGTSHATTGRVQIDGYTHSTSVPTALAFKTNECGFSELSGEIRVISFGANPVSFGWSLGVVLSAGSPIIWGDQTYSAAPSSAAVSLKLFRDAANILAQRNTTNAQAIRIYNTWTDVSNYERAAIDWQATSNTLTIGAQAAGTGTLRAVAFVGASFAFPSAKPVGFLGATPASQQTHVADASTAHDLNATFSDTEVETALNNLGTKINSILTTLEAFGFHATA